MKFQKDLISIIMPAHNVSRYIETAVKSITNQTYTDIELIIIDDGSTDETALICKKLCDEDNRIKFLRQENKGVASARKTAAYYATGEYMTFVDSDDWIVPDYLQRLFELAEDYDLVTSGFYKEDESGQQIIFDKIPKGAYKTKGEMAFIISNMIYYDFRYERGLTSYIWNKLFRTEKALKVFEKVNERITVAEDSEFLYRYVLNANSVRITDICGYHYRIRENSLVTGVNKTYMININELYLTMQELFMKHPQREELIIQLEIWMTRMMRVTLDKLGFHGSMKGYHGLYVNSYIFPFYDLPAGTRIILYGAGKVGKDYYFQLEQYGRLDLISWLDKNHAVIREDGYGVGKPSDVMNVEYDYIIIAVKDKRIAEGMACELKKFGVQEEKLLWRLPKKIMEK